MSTVTKFEDLRIWQEARQLVREIYHLTNTSVLSRDYGLSSQLQRSAVSVMANIAEGFERSSNKEFVQYLFQAKASCGELRSHLYVVKDLGYGHGDEIQNLQDSAETISKGIGSFITYLKQTLIKGKLHSAVKRR